MAIAQPKGGLIGAGMVMLVCLAVQPAWSQDVNLALRQPFTANCGLLPGWDGLTDGVKDSDEPPSCLATDDAAKFPKQVVVDLGGRCEVNRVVVHNSGNGNTRLVDVALSGDAKNYTVLREYIFPAGKYQPLVHRCTPKQARFVRVTFRDTWGTGLGGKNIMYLREAEVYGKRLEPVAKGAEALWGLLATSKPEQGIPSWAATRRYLGELSRAARLTVVTDQPAEPLIGPQGWLAMGLRDAKGAWTGAGVQVKYVQYRPEEQEKAARELEEMMRTAPPDLLILAPSAQGKQPFVDSVAKVLEMGSKAGASTLLCVPPPPTDGNGSTELDQYRKIRRELLVHAAGYPCGVLDVGALLARMDNPTKLLAAKGWAPEAVNAVAGALARLLAE